MKRLFLGVAFVVLHLFFLLPKNASAETLATASDTITTSRPSASAPLNADQAANATMVTVVDNGSIYLASDSATLRADTGETQNTVTIASMSAQIAGTPNTRYVYFVSTAANTHHAGDPVTVAVTAMHKVQFTTVNAIPASGKIVITFPGSANNTASPSATTFAFNGLSSTNIKPDNVTCNTLTISSPNITCTTTAGVAAATTVTFLIGCSANSGSSCTTAVPTLINPTKTAAAGTADTWKLQIKTQDSSSVDIDSVRIKIGTVEAVQVQATVDPTLTVVIAGLANGANFNTVSGCASETTNSGVAATATTVDLGALGNGVINIAGQTITVSTNSSFGYAITATSSGRFIDAATGQWIKDANGGDGLTANDTPAPAALPATGNPAFGIGPCGTRVPTSSPDWDDESALAFGSGGKLSNPWNSGANSYYATLASYTGGPVSSDVTAIRYGATVSSTTPAGIYTTVFTYVVTPTF